MERSRSFRQRSGALAAFLRVGAAGALVAVLLSRTDIGRALDLVRDAGPGALLAAVLAMAVTLAIGSVRWWLLLRSQGLMLPFHFVLRVQVAGYALSTVLPTSVGGDLLRVGYTTKDGRVEAALATVLFDRIIGVGGLLVICDLASLLLLARTGSPGLLAVAVLATGVTAALLLALAIRPAYKGLVKLAAQIRFLRLGERMIQVADGIRRYRTQPRLLLETLGLSVLLWLVYSLVWFLLGASIHLPATILCYLVCVPLVALTAMLPISIGGLGVRENSFVILMGRCGTPEVSAAAVALLFLGVTVFYALVGALLSITLRTSVRPLAGLRATSDLQSETVLP